MVIGDGATVGQVHLLRFAFDALDPSAEFLSAG